MRRLRWVGLFWGLAWAVGCSGGSYRVDVSFDAPSTAAGIQTIELMLIPGTCSTGSDADGSVDASVDGSVDASVDASTNGSVDASTNGSANAVSSIVLDRGVSPLPSLSNVPPGQYMLYARGIRGSDCTVVAEGCTTVTVKNGGSGMLSVQLAPTSSGMSACTMGGMCDGQGHCISQQPNSCAQAVDDTHCVTTNAMSGLCKSGTCVVGCPSGAPDNTLCVDANGHNGLCVGGVCTADCIKNSDCDDGNPCNGTESCDTSNGTCHSGTNLNCDNGNPCDGTETCEIGVGCQPGTAPSCDDGNPCTSDSCDPSSGCQHTPLMDGMTCMVGMKSGTCSSGECDVGCTSDADCDDGDVCNGIETCDTSSGKCQPGTPLTCDDGKKCNGTETCDPVMGCQPGIPLNCDDGNSCTKDSCNNSTGCQNSTCLLCILCL